MPAVLAAAAGFRVEVVEPSTEVRAVARRYFGVGALERTGEFGLIGGCGAAWAARAASRAEADTRPACDIVVVDAEAAGVAPPPALADAAFWRALAVARPAVVGVNAIGDEAAFGALAARAREALPDGARFYECRVPRAVHGDDAAAAARQRLLFCVRGLSAAGADAGSIAARLQSVLDREARPLIDEPALWLRELRCL